MDMSKLFVNDANVVKERTANDIMKEGVIIKRGVNSDVAKRIQEWLTLGGFAVTVDGDFGPATEAAVKAFQKKASLPPTGTVDSKTWLLLIGPLTSAFTASTSGVNIVGTAYKHLAARAREVGGENAGPWVRIYARGNEGVEWPWCAGFVSFILRQAYAEGGQKPPLSYTLSCDVLGQESHKLGKFVPLMKRDNHLKPGDIFLLRGQGENDYMHTGIVTVVGEESFGTIEGNTNDDGSREGYKVCRRTRAYKNVDFISI